MASVGTIAMNLIARTRVFTRKMKLARRSVRLFSSAVALARRSMRRMAIGALALTAGLGYLIRSSMQSIDQIGKLARRLNITTEALVGFQHAAEIAGVSHEALSKSISMMVRRLGEANTGVGEARYGLRLLGLSATKLINAGPEEAFLQIADAIHNLATASERAYAAYTIFGRQGQQLLTMFERGRSGVQAMRLDAEKLGLAFSAIDAAQIEMANDAITRLKRLFTGIARTLTIQLALPIEAATTAFVDWATKGRTLAQVIVDGFEAAALAVAKFGRAVANINVTLFKNFPALYGTIFGDEAAARAATGMSAMARQEVAIRRAFASIRTRAAALAASGAKPERLQSTLESGALLKNVNDMFARLVSRASQAVGRQMGFGQQVRTAHVSVAGLAMGAQTPEVLELKKQTALDELRNKELTAIKEAVIIGTLG